MIDSSILEIGLPITITKDFDTRNINYKTKIIGGQRDIYLILELPQLNGQLINWPSGTSCTVSFVLSQIPYQFKTIFIKSVHIPYPIMFIKFPQKIENATTREYERIQTYIDADLYPLDDKLQKRGIDIIGEEHFKKNAVLRDFSCGGGLIEVKNIYTSFSVGEKIGLFFLLPNGETVENLVCDVRNIRIESGKKLAGIKFTDLNSAALKKVTDFLEECSAKPQE